MNKIEKALLTIFTVGELAQFLGCSTNEIVSRSRNISLEGKNQRGKTELFPISWKGDANYSDKFKLLPNENTLDVIEIKGNVESKLKAEVIYNDTTFVPADTIFSENDTIPTITQASDNVYENKKTIDAYLKRIPLKDALKKYLETNTKLKNKSEKNRFLSKEVPESLSFNKIYGFKEEFDQLNDGIYGFRYIAANNKDSLTGIFVVDKGKIDSLYEANKVEKKDKKKKQKTLETKIDTSKTNNSIDLGIGYEIKEIDLGNLTGRYNIGNLILGLELGYGENTKKYPDRIILTPKDPITGFIGNGISRKSEEIINSYIGLETGYNIGNVSFILGPGLESSKLRKTEEVQEYLINNLNNIVAYNKNGSIKTDIEDKFRINTGLDLNLKNFKLGFRVKPGKDY